MVREGLIVVLLITLFTLSPQSVRASSELTGIQLRTSPFRVQVFHREQDEGCGTELRVLSSELVHSDDERATDAAVLQRNEERTGSAVLQLTCNQDAHVVFEFSPTGSWSQPWAVAVSTPHEGRFLTVSPPTDAVDVFPVVQGLNTIEMRTFFPDAQPLYLTDWRVVSASSSAVWYEESSGASGFAWRNESSFDSLVWSRTSGAPLLSQVLPLEGCYSLGDLFLPLFSSKACRSGAQPVVFPLPQGKRWSVNSSTVVPVQGIAAQKPSAPGDVIISEVSWAGSYKGTTHFGNDQWLELHNPTSTYWNLTGVRLSGLGIGSEDLAIRTALYLPPQGYVVIARQQLGNSLLGREPDMVFTNMRVRSTLTGVKLLSNTGVELDHLPDGSWQAGFLDTDALKVGTAQRTHPSAPGNDWSSWGACQRGEEERCFGEYAKFWKPENTQNNGTPWNPNLL